MKDIALHIMDIVRNSVEAKAQNVAIIFSLDKGKGTLLIIIKDDGCGMDSDLVKRVTDPFTTTRTTRKVGMGLPLFKMSAEQTGGFLTIKSEKDKGTEVLAVFKVGHIDCVPLGDLAGTLTLLISGNPGVNYSLEFFVGDELFELNTSDIQEIIGSSAIGQPKVIRFIKEMIQENMENLGFKY